MLQPFEIFRPMYVNRLLQLKRRYMVSQSYHRAFQPSGDNDRQDIILSDYSDPGLAKIHFNAVKGDRYGAIIDLENERHLAKLKEMLLVASPYRLYWAVVKSTKDLQDTVTRVYKEQMRRYIDNKTNWRISAETTLYPTVQITFGELFIVLKYGSQTLRIKFEEIEAL